MKVNSAYTTADHQFRDVDGYAAGKYRWTIRVIKKLCRGDSALNVGCGSGLFNTHLLDLGFSVVALEPDRSAFAVASREAAHRLKVHNTGIDNHGLQEQFDCVVAHDVLEHIDDDLATVKEIFRLLRPGGIFVGSVPAVPSLFGLHDELLGHYRRYSKESLQHLLSSESEIVGLRYFGFIGVPIVWYFSKHKRNSYPMSTIESQKSLYSRIWNVICRMESFLRVPIGSSLLFVVRKPRRLHTR